MTKYIFVTGGVTSSLGKGIIAASLAKLLQSRGFSVTIQKFDPYINVDPGTMNPYEHGECFVTDDGAETDLDLGYYERFLGRPTSQANNVTTGRIYQTVIQNERRGDYLGKTVQVIPHITDEIKHQMTQLGQSGDFDIVITELGGTVGDIESLPYLEAVRQMRWGLGTDNCLVIHLTLLPYLAAAKELKTKPTQHSVKELQNAGIQPDILVCRTDYDITNDIRRKIALFCNVDVSSVIEAITADTVYDVPLLMMRENLDRVALNKLRLMEKKEPDLKRWKEFLGKLKNPTREINICLVGKYIELKDAYKSIYESIVLAGAENECEVVVTPISSEELNEGNVAKRLAPYNGVIVAPGFGERGFEGKIAAVKFARENLIPFFGICLGMQTAVVEFARNVLLLEGANSTEMNPDAPHKVIDLMAEQKQQKSMGGTMRLGAYPCRLKRKSKVQKIYGVEKVEERHRHRYEMNNAYLEQMEKAGMKCVGINPDTELVEVIELKDHPWFIATQYHPEYKSTVEHPHPLFVSFIAACVEHDTSLQLGLFEQ